MKFRKTEKNLRIDVFSKLVEIFNDKSWEIEDGPNEVSLFNRFCSTLSELSDDQQMLILEMTERFTRIKFEEYLIYIKKVLDSLVNDKTIDITSINNIYIAPLISPDDFGKSKSSTMVQYSIRGIIQNIPEIAFKRIIYTDGLKVDSEHINKEDSILLLVDDFVGTGETAYAAIDHLNNVEKIDKKRIVILTIAALEAGISYLESLEIIIFTALVFKKGITDFYPSEIVSEKITLMESIEKKIKVHKNERLGFKGSEALITLIRTPNNTFPVFWKEKNNRIAPFPR
ncbi:phosphoribosyltransferase [Rummeliibacillus suwonensis]|uniref:phosphoribosyltransferase n=1 Tax=Rummeliibacillus suwonensis TaxID=1306154 RepID=UPI0011B35F75|nr:phosphoribosyltransferase [Rummeliibacillus suwonensis]